MAGDGWHMIFCIRVRLGWRGWLLGYTSFVFVD